MLDKFDLLEADYIDTAKVRYIVHPYSPPLAAEAAWCADDQGKFFEFQHALYERQGAISLTQQDALANLATTIGLDGSALAECLSNRTHRTQVESVRRTAAQRGVEVTPTFFINGQKITGNQPYPEFQRLLDQALTVTQ